MVFVAGGVALFAALAAAVPAVPADIERFPGHQQQRVLQESLLEPNSAKSRELKGRFLHITDLHPDPYYKSGTDPYNGHPCHHGHAHSHNKIAQHYGAPTTACDSPFTLINATFRWIAENIRDEIDFVVWTGDSARHDNDDDIPRDHKQVEGLNMLMVKKFEEVFARPGGPSGPNPTDAFIIPIVPSFGNNDILPHNIFFPGPNDWTRNYIEIWKKFIPESQKHTFARGGWFWTEVIPNRLAVISLNTLYFFDRNAAVDGCDVKTEPGYEHMEWLRIQLQFLRERGMKAFLIGHVPPARTQSKRNWDETCYQKYVLWLRQYRDVIVAGLYGHMNVDHFMFQDVKHLKYDFPIDGIDLGDFEPLAHNVTMSNNELHTWKKETYLNELRIDWSELPAPPKDFSYSDLLGSSNSKKNKEKERQDFFKKIGGPYGERYSISIVSPSVVPNYFPSMRIVEYNITGIEHEHPASERPRGYSATEADLHQYMHSHVDDGSDSEQHAARNEGKSGPSKPHFPVPLPPAKTSPPGPAYSPQTLSLLRWTQLFANLTQIHERMDADKRKSTETELSSDEYKHFEYQTEYTTNKHDIYQIRDLTMGHWLNLAERMGRTVYSRSEMEEGLRSQKLPSEPSSNIDTPATLGATEDSVGVGEDVEVTRKKKHKKSRGKLKDNKLWHEFIRRAYVYSKTDDELQDDFG